MVLGARHLINKRGWTAKSYIQDGLIAMWDCLENVGFGQFDQSATTWVDLSGNGYDMSMTGYKVDGKFSADGAYAAQPDMLIAAYLGYINLGSDNSYGEIVFSFSKYVTETWGQFIALNRHRLNHNGGNTNLSGASFDFRYNTSNLKRYHVAYGVPYGWGQSIRNVSSSSGLPAGVYQMRGSPMGSWLNGLKSTGSMSGDDGKVYCSNTMPITTKFVCIGGTYYGSGSGISGTSIVGALPTGTKIKSIRIYNSQLSESDMSANYAVDSARFQIGGGVG